MTDHERTQASEFANVLRALLDDTGVFSRDEWAEILGVTTAAISQWVNDRTIPRPNILRNILDAVRKHCGESDSAIQKFHDVARKPAERVSPFGARMRPTLGNYVVRPILEGFQRTLQTVPPEKQEQILFRAAAECRRLRVSPAGEQRPPMTPARWYGGSFSTSLHGAWRPISQDLLGLDFGTTSTSVFVGRQTELRTIRDLLSSESCVLLSGAAGIGKTALAAALLQSFIGESSSESVHRIECRKQISPSEFWPRLFGTEISKHSPIKDVTSLFQYADRRKKNLYIFVDDLDEAQAGVIVSVGKLIRQVEDRTSNAKIILTCRDATREMVYEKICKFIAKALVPDIKIPKLEDDQIRRLWTLRLENVGLEADASSIQRAVWLSSGSPGYCNGLAEELERSMDKTFITEDRLGVATKQMLKTALGLGVMNRWTSLSLPARTIVARCALVHEFLHLSDFAVRKARKPQRQKYPKAALDVRHAIREVTEGENALITKANQTGTVLKLSDDATRPYLRSLAWTEMGMADAVHKPAKLRGFENADLLLSNRQFHRRDTSKGAAISSGAVVVMQRIREKIREGSVVFFPQVITQIKSLRQLKSAEEDVDYQVTHIGLLAALRHGIATQVQYSSGGWSIDVQGIDTDGNLLAVSVYLPEDETGPLAIQSLDAIDKH